MFSITVKSAAEALPEIQQRRYDYGVTLLGVEHASEHCPKPFHDGHCLSVFDDVIAVTPKKDGGVWIPPTIDQIEDVLAFSERFSESDRILIHCWAGKSRSPAIAIGILMHHGWSYERAFSHVLAVRPEMIPNRLIINMLDNIFNLNGELTERNERFHNRHKIKGLEWSE